MVDQSLSVSASVEETLSMRGLKLIKKVGEGSYAKVFLAIAKTNETKHAEATKSQSTLACKIIDAAKAPKDFIKKFLPRELDILLKLNHPHIVHIHSIFQRRMKYFILMRYAEKGDLLQYILKHGQLAENQARVWARQIALAVQYLHEMNIAHRDLKCENILITANQNTKLSDFGFSRFVVDAKKKPILSNTYCGSLSYAAPEVLRGTPYVPRGADVWSLGILLYVMINKSMPFDDSNIRKLYELQMKRKWKFRAKVVGISEQCKKLVTMMMEPDVGSRFTIDQVVNSEWIAMDSRLATLSPMEAAAYEKAKEDKNTTDYSDKTADALDAAVESRFSEQGKTEPRLVLKSRSRSPELRPPEHHSLEHQTAKQHSEKPLDRQKSKIELQTVKTIPSQHRIPETRPPEPQPTEQPPTRTQPSESRSSEPRSPEHPSPKSRLPENRQSVLNPPERRPTVLFTTKPHSTQNRPTLTNVLESRPTALVSIEPHSTQNRPTLTNVLERHPTVPLPPKHYSESHPTPSHRTTRLKSKHVSPETSLVEPPPSKPDSSSKPSLNRTSSNRTPST